MRLGSHAHQTNLSESPIPSTAFAARPKKAAGAVATSILTAAYHMLKNGTPYQDLGPDHFQHKSKAYQALRIIDRLKHLGYTVQIAPTAA